MPKQKDFFNFTEGFLRKSSFCTLADLNRGFGGPWDIFWKFFINDTFTMIQKNAFGQICQSYTSQVL